MQITFGAASGTTERRHMDRPRRHGSSTISYRGGMARVRSRNLEPAPADATIAECSLKEL
jgi:hypothetical protein